MAKPNLELSIYTFTLKERHSREDYFNFNEFYRKNFTKDDESPNKVKPKDLYERFVGIILDEFENKFWLNKSGDKGISTKDITYRAGKSIIEGIINGGNTGYGFEIYNILNNSETVGKLTDQQLASLPYYFKMWTPPDSQVGVLMIQGYSIGSINSILIEFIKPIFAKYGATFNKVIHIPKELREDYLKRSSVRKVTYTKTISDPKSRKKFNRAYEDSEGLKVTITVSRIKKNSISKFWKKFKKDKPIGFEIKELGIESPDDYETKVYYTDDDGRKANAKIQDSYNIRPTIVLPQEVLNENGTPNLEEIIDYTDKLLDKVKKEVNY